MSAHIGALSSLSIIPLLIHLLRCPFKGATHLMPEHQNQHQKLEIRRFVDQLREGLPRP